MKQGKWFVCYMAAVLLVGCAESDELQSDMADGTTPVRLTATMKGPQLTRAALHLNEDALTSGTVSVRTSSDYTTAYSYTAGAGGVLSSDAPAYYPAGGANIDVVAYTPADAANATSNTFTVSADQTANAGYVASDLLWAGATSKNSRSGQVAMAFEHKMAKIIVRVTASGGVSHINSVTLKNVKRQCVFTYATGAISDVAFVSGENQDQVSVCSETPNTVSVSEGAACIPAQTLPADEFIVIGTSEGTAVYSLSEAKSVAAGCCYVMNINVTTEAIGATTVITGWDGNSDAAIVGSHGEFTIAAIAAQPYTGSAVTPAITVTDDGVAVAAGNYDAYYVNNINAGTATVYAVGKNTYAGKVGVKEFTIFLPPGVLNGRFTVNGSGKQVMFSQGNLQATNTTANSTSGWTWAFAEHQWDYIGNATANTKVGNNVITTAGTVDLFGWVGNTSTLAAYGINNNGTSSNYGNQTNNTLKSDWGTLAITNGGNTANSGWFTLSKDEWVYLFNTRTASTVGGTANGRYAKATVNGVSGVILFPDSYTHPDGVTAPASVNTSSANFTANSYDATAWGKMETAGAVFLPAAGSRNGTAVNNAGSYGYYWSSSPHASSANDAYNVYLSSSGLNPQYNGYGRFSGRSVRLVRQVE